MTDDLSVLLWVQWDYGMILKMNKNLCPTMSDSLCFQQIYYDVKYSKVHTRLNSGLFIGSIRVRYKHGQELCLNTRLPSLWP